MHFLRKAPIHNTLTSAISNSSAFVVSGHLFVLSARKGLIIDVGNRHAMVDSPTLFAQKNRLKPTVLSRAQILTLLVIGNV